MARRKTSGKTANRKTASGRPAAAAPAVADVAVAGAGMIGLTAALAFAQAGLRVTLLDQASPAALTDRAYDGRTTALSRASKQVLQALGVWPALAPAAEPILAVRVADGVSGAALTYDVRDLDEPAEADGSIQGLGWIVDNRDLRLALFARIARTPAIRLRAPATITAFSGAADGARLTLADGGEERAWLVAAADGARSTLRQLAGIATQGWAYGQEAFVATLAHAAPHDGVSHEIFWPDGPLAMLPLADATARRGDPAGLPHRSALVWSLERRRGRDIHGLDETRLNQAVAGRTQGLLGETRLTGQRGRYPLGVVHAERYVMPRLALLGDAGHRIHPIAGQGANLGFRDAAALAEVVGDAAELGLDFGMISVLRRYERWRRPDNTSLVLATDGLTRLFGNDRPVLRLARSAGLRAVDRMGPAKRLLMNGAMGLVGTLPRLVQGEPLGQRMAVAAKP